MILLSASQSVSKTLHLKVVETTPPVSTKDWYRFWRVDARKIRGIGEMMLFTNYETLYTFVADARGLRDQIDVTQHFLKRYDALFEGHFVDSEEVVIHRAADRSVQGVMNGFFLVAERSPGKRTFPAWEERFNNAPALSRNFQFPSELLHERLRKTA